MAPNWFWQEQAIPFIMDHKLGLPSTSGSSSVATGVLATEHKMRLDISPAP